MKTKTLKIATAVLAVITTITAIVLDLQIYLSHDGKSQMYTAENIGARLPVLAILALLFIVCALITALMILRERSTERFIASKELYEKGIYSKTAAKENEKKTNLIRLVLLAAAVVFIIFGIFNGGLRDVLVKAINICTECIGLG